MIGPKWIAGISTAFAILTLICGTLEGTYLGTDAVGRLQKLLSLPAPTFSDITSWLSNLWGILTFDYAFFHGGWSVFRYVFFWPIGIGTVVTVALMIFQAITTAARALVSLFTGGKA